MKKILLSIFAISALLFTSCEDSSDDNGYVLKITPSTVAIGEQITLTVTGDGAEDMNWTSCFNRTDDGTGSCLVPNFVDGSMDYTISESLFSAGEYKFYATYAEDSSIVTGYTTITVTE
ncbi:MAG: hypothetical protein SNI45_05925 [Rikenellaceae bacterium]